MALYEIKIKHSSLTNGIQLEKGMSVEVVCNSHPVSYNGGVLVHEAFARKYGIDSKRAGALTPGRFEVERLG
jgi:5,10-methenyltetrahydromethanopterin hydrogenase